MEGFSWFSIIWAGLLGVMLWRMIPTVKHWLKNGPKGSNSDWMTAAMLIGGVALFVVFLMMAVG